jgi:serine/threonine protein kinase
MPRIGPTAGRGERIGKQIMNTCCSHELLESALAGNLSAQDESVLGNHLESCEACSAALEQMAGGPAWCREAASLLASDELDVTAPSSDRWSEIDFTVEHLEPSDDPSALGRLGGYDILAVIGQGGMGIVLKGYDRELKRLVAIKVLAPHLAQSPLARKRFAREAQAAAAVVHPNVLAIHQVQPSGRLPFLVMPLVAGQSLAERLAAEGMLELKEILRIAMQAAAGLAAAHEQGLVHRDVKPANILLEKGVERAVLTDFGLARAADDVTLTRLGVIAGTPQYMSPEQARGEALDGRSDLFSLGCVMYEMATGVSPFKSESMLATMRRLVDDAPQAMQALNPELPPWFVAIVNRLLEKDAPRRFGSAKELSELLEGCLAHVQQPAHVPLPIAAAAQSSGCARRPGKSFFWAALTSALSGTCQKSVNAPPIAADEWRPFSRATRAAVAAILLGIGGIIAFMAGTSEPSDISGQWTGEDWGTVTLKQTAPAEYEGTYTDTFGKEAGKIELKWSRIERQYTGDWSEGKSRFGKISVRQVGDEIRGAWTADRKSRINPGTPGLAPLTWTRPKAQAAAAGPLGWTLTPVISFELRSISNRMGVDALRLEDRRTFSLPRTAVSREELEKWLDANKVNFAVEYLKDAGQWDMKLRNIKIAELPADQWPIQNASQLLEQFPKLNWNDEANAQADQKEKGFYSVRFVGGLNPPRYAFETSSGQRGVLWFVAQTHGEDAVGENKSDSILIHYKLLQRSDRAGAKGDGGIPNAANLHFGPVVERELNDIEVERTAFPPPAMNLETDELLHPPADIRDFQSAMPWAQTNGADLVACSDGGGRGLRIVGGLAFESAKWDASPYEVALVIGALERGLNDLEKQKLNFENPRPTGFSNLWFKGNDASTFYFKTRGGRIGVLQITGLSDGPAKVSRRHEAQGREITAHTVAFRYKLLVDDSQWSFAPAILQQMHCAPDATPAAFLPAYSLRLGDGHLFRLPRNMAAMSAEERDKWLDETKVNLVIDYQHDADRYEFRLRNVKLAPLPDDDWKTLSSNELRERFAKLKWNVPASADVEQKDKGFYSIKMTSGMTPPMTFVYETTDGLRGIFQFFAANGQTEPQVRYKQVQQSAESPGPATSGEDGKSPDSLKWSFRPIIHGQLYTMGSRTPRALGNEPLRFDNFLRLGDGHRFNMPPGFEKMSAEDRDKWLDETKVNLAIDHHQDTDQWEMKLRNAKFAQLSDEAWASLSEKAFQEQFSRLKWDQPAGADAELKEKGFYSLMSTAGMSPPMTFAFETSDGHRGVLQFNSYATASGGVNGYQVTYRYKLVQQSAEAPDAATPPAGGDSGRATPDPSARSFGPVVERQLTTFNIMRTAVNEPPRTNIFLALDGGRVYQAPQNNRSMSPDDRDRWLDETKINFGIEYQRDSGQWEIWLRNVKFAKIPDDDWNTLTGQPLQAKLWGLYLNGKENANAVNSDALSTAAQTQLHEKGFYSFRLPAGMSPPMTFLYETSEGGCGIFQFESFTQTDTGESVLVRYKQFQSSAGGSSDSSDPHTGGENGPATAEPPDLGSGPAEPKPLPTTEAEKAIARLVLVFYQDRSRRAVPVVLVDAGSQTFAVMAGPADIVPDGTPLAVDRNLLEIPGCAPLRINPSENSSTHELFIFRAPGGLTTYRPTDGVELAVGDRLAAIVADNSDRFHVSNDAAKVVALGRSIQWKVPANSIDHQFENLIQINQSFPEGTPVFKDGKLAGLTLLGTRFVGEQSSTSYVLPVSRIAEFCAKIEREGIGASPPAATPLADAIAKFNTSAAESPNGQDQPPLTEDELIAALRWMLEDGKLTKNQLDELRSIVQKQTLPAGAHFNLITSLDGVDGERFKAWVIELRLPGADGKESVHLIRRQLIAQVDQLGKPIPLGPAAKGDDNSTPLAAAINGFNASNYTIHGVRQQPLTEEEVVAAIRWWKSKRDEVSVTNGEFAALQKIADTRDFPQGAKFGIITGFEPAFGKHFQIWCVRLVMPRQENPRLGFDIDLRWQYVHSEVVVESEIAWGAAGPSGLQAGILLAPRGDSYATGQEVTPTFYYRNSGQLPLNIAFPRLITRGYYNKLIALDVSRSEIPIEQDPGPAFPVGWMQHDPWPPGAIHEIAGRPIMLGDVPRGSAETLIKAAVGQSVHLRFEVPDFGAKDAKPLETGEVVFATVAPDAASGQPETKAAEPRWHSVGHFPVPSESHRLLAGW